MRGSVKRKQGGIVEFEDTIRNKPYEVAAVFTPDGAFLCMASLGRKRLIGFGDEEIVRMKGMVLTHNHPDTLTNTFSVSDVRMASRACLHEIRVVGESNTYSLKPGQNGWPEVDRVSSEYARLTADPGFTASIELTFLTLLLNRPIFVRDREKIENILTWEVLALKLGLVYQKKYPLWYF
jgi:hypothetical protein